MRNIVLMLTFLVFLSSYAYALEQIPGELYLKVSDNYDISSLVSKDSRLSSIIEIEPVFSLQVNRKEKERFGLHKWYKITISKNADISKEVKIWNSFPEIEQASPVLKGEFASMPNDPNFDYQWYHFNDGTNPGPPATEDSDIDSDEAWTLTTGSEILVGNPDEGIEWYHEDLVNNIWQNLGEDYDNDGSVLEFNSDLNRYVFDSGDLNGVDDDSNGYIDDLIGWDFKDNDNNPIFDESEYGYIHGTLTSGLLAADSNNNKGISGTCWNCKIIATRGVVYYPIAFEYLTDNNVRVISVSLLLTYQEGPYRDAIDYAHSRGILIVAAAGNSGNEGSTNFVCNSNDILCVTATDRDDKLTSFSNYGLKTDISAPGYYMYTTNTNNQYITATGTSHSTPLVSGVAALILSINPDLTRSELLSILQSSTDPLVNPTKFSGNGRLNAFNALTIAKDSINKGFPVASLDSNLQSTLTNNYEIYGRASGINFDHYNIYYGEGPNPSTWTLIYSSKKPVENGLLYTINTRPFVKKQSIKLEVHDIHNQVAVDYIYGVQRQSPRKTEAQLPF